MPCLNHCTNPQKTCIETDRVFDIVSQKLPQSRTLSISFTGDPTGYTIVEMHSAPAIMSDLILTPIPGSRNTRVRYKLTLPLTVTAINSIGLHIIGTSSVTVENDIVMRVPNEAAVSARIEASASVTGVVPAPLSETVNLDFCVVVITRVVAKVVLVICSYGYPEIPPAIDFVHEAVCPGADLPIFPFSR